MDKYFNVQGLLDNPNVPLTTKTWLNEICRALAAQDNPGWGGHTHNIYEVACLSKLPEVIAALVAITWMGDDGHDPLPSSHKMYVKYGEQTSEVELDPKPSYHLPFFTHIPERCWVTPGIKEVGLALIRGCINPSHPPSYEEIRWHSLRFK